jgi:hypothetical protein
LAKEEEKGGRADKKEWKGKKKRTTLTSKNHIPGFTWIMSIVRSGGRGILQSKVKVKKEKKS